MKFSNILPIALLGMLAMATCGKKEASLDIAMSDKYEGKKVELVAYEDSVVLSEGVVENGKVSFVTAESDSLNFPVLACVNIDGRTRAFYVIEEGKATLVADSMKVADGTALNRKLSTLMLRLDSVEQLDDMNLYTDFCEKIYNENKENTLGSYFGVEWLKFANPSKVDSLLAKAPAHLRDSRRASGYIRYARLRAATAPGKLYSDFEAEDADGKPLKLSSLIVPGKYTLVDFMASWCRYCIKDFKKIAEVEKEYGPKGLNVVSVAVRDTPENTREAVSKHNMTWPVLYNAARRPYEIYGFSGIPHYMLIGPDGKIIARSESLKNVISALPL